MSKALAERLRKAMANARQQQHAAEKAWQKLEALEAEFTALEPATEDLGQVPTGPTTIEAGHVPADEEDWMRIHDYQGSFEVDLDDASGLYRWRMLDHRQEPAAWQEEQHASVRSAIVAIRAVLESRRQRRLAQAVRDYFAQRLGHASMQMTLDQLQIRGTLDDFGLVAEDYAARPSRWFALDINGDRVERREWPAARKVQCKPPSGRVRT